MRGLVRSVATALVLYMAGATGALADPPARVGRLSLIEGDVTFHDTATREAAPATLNWPVTSGAALSTAPDARAEVRIGSTAIRLDGATALEFVQLDDQSIRLRVEYGAVAVRVRSREVADELVLETRDARVSLSEAGSYRIEAGRAPDTTAVTAFQGAAHVDADGVAVAVKPGRRAEVGSGGRARVVEASADAFDAWTLSRDRADEVAQTTRYVSPETTGYESLDAHGDWREATGYGPVWYPRGVPAGWAPYRAGRWAWIEPWGWTWIDEAPWGFAPFHYGRWALIGGVLGLGPGHGGLASGVCAGARRVGRPSGLERHGRRRQRRRRGLVPARAARSVRARLPVQHRLRAQRERHARHERGQHHQRHADPLRPPSRGAGGHGGARRRRIGRCAGRSVGGARAARRSRRRCRRVERAAGECRPAAAPVRQPAAGRRRPVVAGRASRAGGCGRRRSTAGPRTSDAARGASVAATSRIVEPSRERNGSVLLRRSLRPPHPVPAVAVERERRRDAPDRRAEPRVERERPVPMQPAPAVTAPVPPVAVERERRRNDADQRAERRFERGAVPSPVPPVAATPVQPRVVAPQAAARAGRAARRAATGDRSSRAASRGAHAAARSDSAYSGAGAGITTPGTCARTGSGATAPSADARSSSGAAAPSTRARGDAGVAPAGTRAGRHRATASPARAEIRRQSRSAPRSAPGRAARRLRRKSS